MKFKYQHNDFKTGDEWNVPAKIDFYDLVVPKNGGWESIKSIKDNIFKKYNLYEAKREWKKWALRGSRDAINSLTGYSKDSNEAKTIHQTIVEQFKTRFDEIYYGYGRYQKGSNPIFKEEQHSNSILQKSNSFTRLEKLIEFLKKEEFSEPTSMEIIKICASDS